MFLNNIGGEGCEQSINILSHFHDHQGYIHVPKQKAKY